MYFVLKYISKLVTHVLYAKLVDGKNIRNYIGKNIKYTYLRKICCII
jgi:hypothetical protein